MNQRRNRRSIWATLARRRRAAAEALRFLPNRTPVLSRLLVGTALGCSLLAFAAPSAARAQTIDNTSLSPFTGFGGLTEGSGDFRSYGYAFEAAGTQLVELTVFTAQYAGPSSFHVSLYEMNSGDLYYGFSPGTSPLYSTVSRSVLAPYTAATYAAFETQTFEDLNWNLTAGVRYVAVVVPEQSPGMRILAVQDLAYTTPAPLTFAASPADSNYYDYQYLPVDTVFSNAGSWAEIAFRMEVTGSLTASDPCGVTFTSGDDTCVITASSTITGTADAQGGFDIIDLSTVGGDVTFDGAGIGTDFVNFERITASGSGQVTLTGSISSFDIQSYGADVVVDGSINQSGGLVSTGVFSLPGGGDVTINAGATITAQNGVVGAAGGAITNNGDIVGDNTNGGSIGLFITAGGDATNTGTITADYGVLAVGGPVGVDNSGTISATVTGLLLNTTSVPGADVLVTNSGTISSATGDGVNITVDGAQGGFTQTAGSTTGASRGVSVYGAHASDVDVTISGGSVSGDFAGIYAHSGTGAVSVSVGGYVHGGDTGVWNTTSGAASVDVDGTVHSFGRAVYVRSDYSVTVTGSGTAEGSTGIVTRTAGAAAPTVIDFDGSVHGDVNAVDAASIMGDSDLTIVLSGNVTSSSGAAVLAQIYDGTGDLSVTFANGASVHPGNGQAVQAVNHGTGSTEVIVDNGSHVYGGIYVTTGGTATVTIDGYVRSTWGRGLELTNTQGGADVSIGETGSVYSVFSGGVIGSAGNDHIYVAGSVHGGTYAIYTGPGNDTITLSTTAEIGGNVRAGSGTDTLGLAGTGSGSLYLGQTSGFELGHVTGGTWSLTGYSTDNIAWTIDSGATLSTQGAGLRADVVDNGTLQLRAGSGYFTHDVTGTGFVQAVGGGTVFITGEISAAQGLEAVGTNLTMDHAVTASNGSGVTLTGGSGPISLFTSGSITGDSAHAGLTASSSGGVFLSTDVVSGGVGINVVTTGTGAINLIAQDSVTGTSGHGINLLSASGAINVDVMGSSAITGASDGIHAGSHTGDVDIAGTAGASVTAGGSGIYAFSNYGGDVTIDWRGTINSGYHGVFAQTAGDISITVGAVTSQVGEGVYAHAFGTGDITIHTLGAVTEYSDSGIRAIATAGAVTVTADAAVDGNNYGILAFGGSVNVTTNGAVTGVFGSGVSAVASGNATVNVNDAVTAYRYGVGASSTYGVADVNINAGANVTSSGSHGVRAGGFTATIDVNVAAGAAVSGHLNGVNAYNWYTGPINVTVDGSVDGDAVGLRLLSRNGALTVAGSGDISSDNGDGVNANTGGSGTVTITNTGAIDAGGRGVYAGTTAGGIDIEVADVTSAGTGVYAVTGTGGIDIDVGNVTSNGGRGIVANIADGAATSDINIGVTGTVQGYNGIVATNAGSGGIVIDVQGMVIGTAFAPSAHAIVLSGASSDVTIGYGGLVSSNSQVGLVGTAGNDVVRIQGTLAGYNGAAMLGGGDDTVYLYAGAVVNGSVNAGTGYDRLFLTGSGDATFNFDSGQFSGFDYGRIIGTGHWTLQGTDNIGFSMEWNVGPGGTLDGDTNTFTGDITNDGTVVFDQTFDGTFAYDITGTGNVEVQGGGTLTFTGDLDIDGGIDLMDSSGVEMDGTLDTTGDGIYANVSGEVNIGVGGSITSGGDGVDATSTGGRVIVTTDGGSSIVAGGDGIVAESDIGISIYNNGTIVADPGMNLTATGNADIYVNSAGAITADEGGIVTSAEAGPTDIRVSATVEGDDNNDGNGDAIHSTSTTGSISIHTYAAGDIVGDNANGVYASSNSGAITLTIEGDIGAPGLAVDGRGVHAITGGGDIVIATSGAIHSGGVGVYARETGAGEIDVTVTGSINAGSTAGVYAAATGSGGVSVTTGAASDIESAGNGVRIIANGGTITGQFDGDIGAGVAVGGVGILATQSSGVIDLSVNGDVSATSQGVYATAFGAGSDVGVSTGADSLITSGGIGVSVVNNASGDADSTLVLNGAINSGAADAVRVFATGGTGTIDVTINGDLQTTGRGVYARSQSGDVIVTFGADADVSGDAGYGARAFALNNSLTINVAGDIGTAANNVNTGFQGGAYGVNGLGHVEVSGNVYGASSMRVTGSGGDITADVSGRIVGGLLLSATGTGDTDITADVSGVLTNNGLRAAIYNAASTGDINIDFTGTFTGVGTAITGVQSGSGALNITTGDALGVGGDIAGTATSGVSASSSGGPITVTIRGDIGTAGDRVSTNGVFTSLSGGATGSSTVTVDGAVHSDVNGVFSVANNGGGDVTVHVNGSVNAPFGVTGRTYGAGDADVSIDVTGAVQNATNAVYGAVRNATSTGTVDIDVSGTVQASGVGVWARNDGTGGVVIDTGGGTLNAGGYNVFVQNNGSGAVDITTGTITGAGTRGIEAFSAGDLTIVTQGDIGSSGNGVSWDGVRTLESGANRLQTVTINGDIFSDNTGVLLRSSGANSDIVLDVNGDVSAFYGVFARNTGTGDADISITVDGAVTGSRGVYGRIYAGTGTLDIDVTGALNVSSFGISGVNNGSGGIDITTTATAGISGDAVNGILANGTAGGAIVVNSAGNIGSAANEVSGNGIYGRNAGTGSVSLTNSGDIWADQFGVYGRATSSASVVIANSGDLTAGRTGLRAIGSTGVVTVTNTGTVTVDGTNPSTASLGIYAFSNNSITVNNSGDIVVTSNDTGNVEGIRVFANNGFATVYSAGDITLNRLNANQVTRAIDIVDADLGARVVVDGDLIVNSSGENFAAINVSSGGDVYVSAAYFDVTGSINGAGIQVVTPGAVTVNLTEGHTTGGNAEAVVVYGSLGAVQINVGEASTSGADSQGILVGGGATGAVTVTADSVTTDGAGAHGIQVTTSGHIDITATDVTTVSGGAAGIVADGDALGLVVTTLAGGTLNTSGAGISATTAGSNGAIDINVDGDINAGGAGVVATGGTGLVDITANGDVSGSSGIVASTGGAGNVNVYSSGNVTGVSGAGISAQTDSGAIDITFSGVGIAIQAANNDGIVATTATGTIGVTGADGDLSAGFTGIYAHVTGSNGALVGPAIDIDWNGGLTAAGTAVLARTVDGDIDVSINGAHAGLAGVYATSGSGDISVINTGIIYSSGASAGARGVFADTAGDVYVSSLAVYTGTNGATDQAEGIRVEGGNVEVNSGLVITNGIANSNAIHVIATGSVDVTSDTAEGGGTYGRGIVVETSGAITVDSGTVRTFGFGSAGIDIYGGAGDVSVTSDSVTTYADSSAGVVTRSTGEVTIDSGSVTTTGANSTGIVVMGGASGGTITSDSVSATGVGSAGILVANGQGDFTVNSGDVASSGNAIGVRTTGAATITSSGAVSTTGGQGDAIVAYADSAHVTLTGSVTTSGYDAEGLLVVTTGDATIDGGGDVITNAAGAAGVFVRGGGDVSVTLDDIVTAGGDTYFYGAAMGVYARSLYGDVSVVVDSVSTSGGNADGVRVSGPNDVTVVLGSVTTTGATAMGARVTGDTGNVSVTATGPISASGSNAVGLRVSADEGAVYVTNTGTVSGGLVGILAASNSGDVTVTAQADVAGGGLGIQTSAGAGATHIDVAAGVTVSGGTNDGIHADAGTGDVDVYIGLGATVGSTLGDGLEVAAAGGDIRVISYGAISGDPGVVLSNTGSGNISFNSFGTVTGEEGGIVATAEAGTIILNVYGTVEGDDDNDGTGNAIAASVTTGTISIYTSASGDIVGDNANGIVALVTGGGATGDITITADGDIGSALTGVDGVGVYAVSLNGGSADVSLTGSANIYAGFTGVIARASGADSDVYVNLSGNVSGGYNGIVAGAFGTGDTDITITTSGLVTAANNGIEGQVTNAASTGTVTVDVNGDVDALRGASLVNMGSGGIVITTDAASTITAASVGLNAYSGGASDIQVTANGEIVSDGRGINLNVGGTGDGDITVVSNGLITAGDDGISARVLNAANTGTIDLTVNNAITASGTGVFASNVGTGGLSVTTSADGDIAGTASTGVFAYAGGGAVVVHHQGDIGSAVDSVGGRGVDAELVGSGSILVDGSGAIFSGDDGVFAYAAGAGPVDITVAVQGEITAANGGVRALNTAGGDSDVTITTSASVDAQTVGLYGLVLNASATGDVIITANASIEAGNDGIIGVNAGYGLVSIAAYGGVNAQGDGIAAYAGSGPVSVRLYADVTAGDDGIYARSTTGDISITTGAGYTITALNGDGIDARSNSGDITVASHADIIADPGILLATGGAGVIQLYSFGSVTANDGGIDTTTASGLNKVYVYGAVEGDSDNSGGGDAIHAVSGGGLVNIHTFAGGDIVGSNASGIVAINTGASASGITITQQGQIGASGAAMDLDGIRARITNAGSTADIVVDGQAAIFAGNVGILAVNQGSGDISVTTSTAGDITAGGDGILAAAYGGGDADVTILANGTVTAGGHGLYAYVDGGTGLITITANDVIAAGSTGIRATNLGAGGIVINQATTGSISGSALDGVAAHASGGSITIHNNGEIGAAGDTVGVDGVYASLTGGSGAITIDGSGAIFASDDGVDARTLGAGADILINLVSPTADVVAGGDGLYAAAGGAGDSDVTVFTNGAISAGQDGIDARIVNAANTGTITVTANDAIAGTLSGWGVSAQNVGTGGVVVTTGASGDIAGSASNGIRASAAGGGVTVHNDGDIGSSADAVGFTGVLAANGSGGGNVLVDGSGAVFAGGVGIQATNASTDGDITVSLTAASADVTAGGDGILAAAYGGGDADVTIFTNGTVTAGGHGLYGYAATGTGLVSITANDLVTAGSTGIRATNFGSGGIVITQAATGDIAGSALNGIVARASGGTVVIHNDGDIGSAADAVAVDGVYAALTGAGAITIDGAGPIFAGDDGVDARTSGAGADISVLLTSAAADISAGGDGIYVLAAGTGDSDVTIVMNGAISAGQDGVDARISNAANTGTITVTVDDAITGALSGWGVSAQNAGTGGTLVTTGALGDVSGAAFGGIRATATGGGVTVHNNGDVGAAGNPVTLDGVVAANGNGGGDVRVDGSGAVFAGNVGIRASNSSANGDITIDLTAASADVTAGGDGILAAAYGGGDADVTIFTNGTVTAGGHGLYAYVNGGSGLITITANDLIDAGSTGIRATNRGAGGILISQAAAADIGGNALFGVVAQASGGDIVVHNNGDIGVSGNLVSGDGVYARLTGGSGAITVDGSGAIFAGDDGVDARTTSAGADIVINLTSASADIMALDDAIFATASGAGDSDLTVVMSGAILAGGDGVEASLTNAANTGTVSVTLNDAILAYGWGTRIDNQGTGGITVITSAAADISGAAFGGHLLNAGGGTVSVSGAGDIGSSGNAVTNDGVRVTGSADLISMTGTGGVFAGDDGFDLNTSAAGGDITVNLPSTAIIRATDDGLYASATGTGDSDVTITFAGSIITTSGNGVDARITNAANTGTLIVNANASVTSGGTAAAINTVNNGVAVSSTTTINVASGVIITGGTVSGASYAIDSDGGPTTINNAGTINGFVNLTDSADTVNNTGLWNALGTGGSASLFGLGTDTVNNQANARIEIAPASVAATTVTWTGLEAFNNNGGVVDLRQGHTGDVFSMLGATFTGSNVLASTSRLQIDATLSFPLTADRMNIGAAAGVTTVQLVDLTPAQPGALDLTGVIVVDATSGPSTAFTLEGGPIDKGFVEYNLVFDPANFDWRLMGLPSAEAFEMLKLGQASQSFWRHSADTWTARMQEVRDAQGQPNPSRSEGWEMWAQAHVGGEEIESRPTYTFGIATLTPNLDNDTSWRGFQMGADKLVGNSMYGITGGFQQQETDFSADNNGLDLEGWNLGAYAGWNSGGAFVNGLVKADWYSIDVNMRTAPAMAHVNAWTWGAKAEAGFRFGGPGFFVEPVADVAYTDTSLDDAVFPAFAASFRYRDTISLRAQAGVRVGGIWGSIAPFAGVYAGEEFEGENDMTMFTGPGCPSCMTIQDQPIGSFGKAEYGFNILNWGGLEGFLKGETLFGGDASGTNVKLGVRWRW
jgi:uncharacterized protein YhjY with autotransporter beta-barrel domain